MAKLQSLAGIGSGDRVLFRCSEQKVEGVDYLADTLDLGFVGLNSWDEVAALKDPNPVTIVRRESTGPNDDPTGLGTEERGKVLAEILLGHWMRLFCIHDVIGGLDWAFRRCGLLPQTSNVGNLCLFLKNAGF